MASKRTTAAALADASGMEIDEVLVKLWDIGVEIDGPDDPIPTSQLAHARDALGVATPRKLRQPEFWMERLRLDPPQFHELLTELGVGMSSTARTLPKGAVRKLRAKEREIFGGPIRPAVVQDASSLEGHEREFESFSWEEIGHVARGIRYLRVEEVRSIHFLLVRDFAKARDPINPPGVKDETMLGSAVHRPQTSHGSVIKYPTIEMAAAALLHALINDHPFHNGNKRTALVAMGVFLYENSVQLTASQDDLFKFVLQVSQRSLVSRDAPQRADREVLLIAQWIRENSRLLERGERVMPWLKFKRALSRYDVQWSHPRKGNRINLSRECVETERVGFRSKKVNLKLSCQVAYRDDGTDVARNTIDYARRELHIDEAHGIDSATFYDLRDEPDDFIVKYQQTLRRLASL